MRHTLYYLIYMHIFIFVLKKQLSKYKFITSLGRDLPEKVIFAVRSNTISNIKIKQNKNSKKRQHAYRTEVRPSDIETQATHDQYIMEVRPTNIETQTKQGPIHHESETKRHINSDNIETHT
jgi:hypothetical protein